MSLFLDRIETPIGTVLVVCDDEARLVALDHADHEDRMRRLLQRRSDRDVRLEARSDPSGVSERVRAYFGGALDALDSVPLRAGGTAFQHEVWRALREIPAGATTSYGRIAAQLGRSSASRAVGHANGANPIAIAIPCHRVVGAGGALTGYAGGLARKRWLLAHETDALSQRDPRLARGRGGAEPSPAFA
jgi:methylated-DNA-[protein]-cysteine S-methyltransferase